MPKPTSPSTDPFFRRRGRSLAVVGLAASLTTAAVAQHFARNTSQTSESVAWGVAVTCPDDPKTYIVAGEAVTDQGKGTPDIKLVSDTVADGIGKIVVGCSNGKNPQFEETSPDAISDDPSTLNIPIEATYQQGGGYLGMGDQDPQLELHPWSGDLWTPAAQRDEGVILISGIQELNSPQSNQ